MSLASVDHFPAEPATRVGNGQRSPGRRTPLDQTPLAIKRAARAGEAPPRSPPIEIAFLSNHGVSIDALNQTAELARRQGVSADAALLAEGVVDEDAFYRALAEHLGAGFLTSEIEFAPGALSTAGLGYARLQGRRDGVRWLFAPSGGLHGANLRLAYVRGGAGCFSGARQAADALVQGLDADSHRSLPPPRATFR